MKIFILSFFVSFLLASCRVQLSEIQEFKLDSTELNRTVKHWVYIPPNYDRGNNFPLLVMHDGQNLFTDSLSFAGEWHVDEVLDSLYKTKGLQIIAVGIENGGKKRINELTPYTNVKHGGGQADAYLSYIKTKLLPYVEKNYKISAETKDKALMGSSLGGLITFYEAFQNNSPFSKFGVYSPSFWFSEKIFNLPKKKTLPSRTKMVLRIGEKEDNEHLNVLKMDSILQVHQSEIILKTDIDPEGEHREWYWSNHIYEDILWMFVE